jgi:hypothetical protein
MDASSATLCKQPLAAEFASTAGNPADSMLLEYTVILVLQLID